MKTLKFLKCMEKASIFAIIALITLTSSEAAASSRTITSEPVGGVWSHPSTWEGGEVPTADDFVIIKGGLNLDANVSCSGAILTANSSLKPFERDVEFSVSGDFTNDGIVSNSAGGYFLTLNIGGDVFNNKIMFNYETNVGGSVFNYERMQGNLFINCGENDKTIRGFFECNISIDPAGPTSESAFVVQDTILSKKSLSVQPNARFKIPEGSVFINYGDFHDHGHKQNRGEAIFNFSVYLQGNAYDFWNGYFNLPPFAEEDSVVVINYGGKAPQNLEDAVYSYWRVIKKSAENMVFDDLNLIYSEEELGSLIEQRLNVYRSDDGETWNQITSGNNTLRYPNENYVSISEVAIEGYFALSTKDSPGAAPEFERSDFSARIIQTANSPRLRIEGAPGAFCKVEIRDIFGRLAYSTEEFLSDGAAETEIILGNIAGGVYFYRIVAGKKSAYGKFVY